MSDGLLGLAPKIPFKLDYQEQSLVPQDSIHALFMSYRLVPLSFWESPHHRLHRLFLSIRRPGSHLIRFPQILGLKLVLGSLLRSFLQSRLEPMV